MRSRKLWNSIVNTEYYVRSSPPLPHRVQSFTDLAGPAGFSAQYRGAAESNSWPEPAALISASGETGTLVALARDRVSRQPLNHTTRRHTGPTRQLMSGFCKTHIPSRPSTCRVRCPRATPRHGVCISPINLAGYGRRIPIRGPPRQCRRPDDARRLRFCGGPMWIHTTCPCQGRGCKAEGRAWP